MTVETSVSIGLIHGFGLGRKHPLSIAKQSSARDLLLRRTVTACRQFVFGHCILQVFRLGFRYQRLLGLVVALRLADPGLRCEGRLVGNAVCDTTE